VTRPRPSDDTTRALHYAYLAAAGRLDPATFLLRKPPNPGTRRGAADDILALGAVLGIPHQTIIKGID